MEFEELLAIETLRNLDEQSQIDLIGTLFDMSMDRESLDGVDKGLQFANEVNERALEPALLTVLFYTLSNGWSYRRTLKYRKSTEGWQFQMEELSNEIIYLRKAIASNGFVEVIPERQCQIYTNLANAFFVIGRFVEAMAYWKKAIEILPNFAMAIGNMANCTFNYGRSLFDNIHANLFISYSYHQFVQALEFKASLHEKALDGFQNLHDQLRNHIAENYPAEYLSDFPNLSYDLGNDLELNKYRLWCLGETLFINPLNDLGQHTVATHDCLNLPTVTLASNRAPVCINLFNQIKQEFSTARYAYYLSVSNGKPHLSDKDVPLVDTMEMVQYSFYLEQMKISFKLAYSILDKIAYLLNDYLRLQIDLNRVSFRSLWFDNRKQLRQFFATSDNWALRGLFWLSKDLYEKDMDFDLLLEEDAKEISLIRNFIEHKGFKLLSDMYIPIYAFSEPDISYSITRSSFEQKTLKLLKLTRAAIMYTAIAVSHEERKKDSNSLRKQVISSALIPDLMRF
ncbi:MAG: hypothetical protein DI535_03880 [Citrobacter freundii]|nr:MAG: hypothetical protein DI535_03880 [Citrobacter freundii]